MFSIINKKIILSFYLICFYLFMIISICFGKNSQNFENKIFYENARTKGMGGACVAVANDYQALFCNPAILGPIADKKVSISNVYFEVNENYKDFKSKLEKLSEVDSKESRLNNNNLLLQIIGKNAVFRGSYLAYYIGPNGLSFAVLHQYQALVDVIRPTNPRIFAKNVQDTVLITSIARPYNNSNQRIWFNKNASGWWAISMKVLARNFLSNEFYARDFAKINTDILKSNDTKGTNADFDLATYWKINDDYNTSIGFIVMNILESNLDSKIGSLCRDASLGIAFQPLQGPPERKQKLTLAIDFHNMFDSYNTYFGKIKLGAESKINDFFSLRAGIRAGYLTGGVNLNYKDLVFDLSTFAEELGSRPGFKQDRRYSANFNFVFW